MTPRSANADSADEEETLALSDRDMLKKLIAPLRVAPGSTVSLPGDFDPGHKAHFVKKADAQKDLAQSVELLAEYQARLAAQDSYSLLVVLQALDAAGKDGTIKHVMSGVNPQGVSVVGFRVPSAEDLQHDFLWRYQRALPQRGTIGIFNRSHYEEVLVVRVHPELLAAQHLPSSSVRKGVWTRRYRAINDWERHLVENGTRVVKLLLNVSREEQRQRFLERIERPEKNWKFSAADVREREYWDDYQTAFSEMLSATSTKWAPWHVIPADHKWFAHLSVAAVLIDALMDIDPRYPELSDEQRRQLAEAGRQLEAEAPAEKK
jgi:PPK2 family polyphosphate:nucleotide phosphotransferase